MHISKFHAFSCLIVTTIVQSTWAQTNEFAAVHDISASINQFAINLLTQTTVRAGENLNLAISPYTVWSLLAIITEGARNNTARQLEQVLQIPNNNKDIFRQSYRLYTKYLLQRANSVQLEISSAIFTTKDQNLNRTYQSITKNFYGVDILPTDFHDLLKASSSINSYISSATRNRIQNFVKIDDIINAEILITSTLFFKGQWKLPFNKTATMLDSFIDEYGKTKGQVMMMYQQGTYPYTLLKEFKAHAVELPYGNDNRFSMIIILPRKGESLVSLLNQLLITPFSRVLDALATAEAQFGEDDVQVYLPRFTVNSDLNLNEVLDHMGIKDMFNLDTADLLGMFPQYYLYVTRIIQQAKIEVNEEGTVASSAAGGSVGYKSPPPKFYANRDFLYFIIDKPTKSIIFTGKVTNPNTICDSCSKKSK